MSFSVRILAAHGTNCPYCGIVMRVAKKKPSKQRFFPTADHVIPKSRKPGQPTIMVCQACNVDKKNWTLLEWRDRLAGVCDPRLPIVAKFIADNPDLAHIDEPRVSACA